MKYGFAAMAAAFALSGCATIFNGTSQPITISSKPDGAMVSVTNRAGESIHMGTTPVTLTLKRGYGYFKPETYKVRFEKAGHEAKEVLVTGNMSGWYIGNLLFGGLIGMLAVDPVTGAMYVFPEKIEGELAASESKTSGLRNSLQVVAFDSLSAEQKARAQLLPVSAN